MISALPLLLLLTAFAPVKVERLPDMQVPRAGHAFFTPDGDVLVAVGGHTTGFVRTQTAEVYKNGRWQPLPPPLYPHDCGLFLRMRDGSFLLGGGLGGDFGIGQSLGLERYMPAKNQFSAMGILDRPRAFATATELADGRIAVSGNLHAEDALAILDTATLGTRMDAPLTQGVSAGSCRPWLFKTSDGNILVLGRGLDDYGRPVPCTVNSWRGKAPSSPVADDWMPIGSANGNSSCEIAPYGYLVPLMKRDSTAYAILCVRDGKFSTLETDRPFPVEGIDGGKCWWETLYADEDTHCAWLTGRDVPGRFYLAKIDCVPAFDGKKAAVTFYCTPEKVAGLPRGDWNVAVLSGGKIAMAGGYSKWEGGNFSPVASAWIFHTEVSQKGGLPWWAWAAGAFLALCAVVFAFVRRKIRCRKPDAGNTSFTDMMTRIRYLMEEKQFFRKPDLKVEDIASELGTNVAYVRGCIVGMQGGSFKDFVNGYRVRHVQRLLLEHPDAKINLLAEEAGFSSTATFYRCFSAICGCSPTEWLNQQNIPK